jgi:hypothetical protein
VIYLGVGALMLVIAVVLLRLARPLPDGTPVTFLEGKRMDGALALLITALFGIGLAASVFGLISLF